MGQHLQKYLTVLIGAFLTLLLSFVSDFLLSLSRETTWIIFSVGSVITITVSLLEQKVVDTVSDEIDAKIEVFSALARVKDPELYRLAQQALSDCLEKIKNYGDGIITLPDMAHMTNRLSTCQESYQATFWVPTLQSLYALQDTSAGRSYYELNLQALKRGVKIERIFIFNKQDVLDENGQFVDKRAKDILLGQSSDGVVVRVAWVDDLQALPDAYKLYQDFGIIDHAEVLVQLYGAGNSRPSMLLIKNREKVSEYALIYQKIRKISRPLNDIL